MNLYFLIGMPGAGKTFWGRAWAEESGMLFIDLDAYVEQQAGMSIPQIFEREGESTFRKRETGVLREIVNNTATQNTIIACGGGTPVWNDNLEVMKHAGCVVYLEADIDTLTRNLGSGAPQRPLLLAGDLRETLKQTLALRKPIYEQAHHVLSVENITVATFAQIQDLCINRH